MTQPIEFTITYGEYRKSIYFDRKQIHAILGHDIMFRADAGDVMDWLINNYPGHFSAKWLLAADVWPFQGGITFTGPLDENDVYA